MNNINRKFYKIFTIDIISNFTLKSMGKNDFAAYTNYLSNFNIKTVYYRFVNEYAKYVLNFTEWSKIKKIYNDKPDVDC